MSKNISIKTVIIIFLVILFLIILITPKDIIKKPRYIGAVVAKVFVSGQKLNYTYNASLTSGFNLVSLPCTVKNNSLENILSSIASELVSVHTYDTTNLTDRWKSYNPSLPSWAISDLSTASVGSGYWINMNSEKNLVMNCAIEKPNSISLYTGWNLVAYRSNESKNTSLALSTIDGKYSIIYGFNATSQNYRIYEPNLGNNTLNILEPDKGYWINATSSVSWFIT